jgi:lipopolysaccharide/colanic/teichoic acid biosynthesis glycosyltransferase
MLNEWAGRVIAVFILIILSPFLLIIIVLSLAFHGSPVFYNHDRVGYHFKLFQLHKFRSMKPSLTKAGITVSGEARVTLWGAFLRKFKIDEIPQLWNIVKGEMCFIGPRPEIPEFVDQSSFSFLESVKPGLTDFASIIFRDEEKLLEKKGGLSSYENILPLKIRLNRIYVAHQSVLLDLTLAIMTGLSVLFPMCARSLVLSWFIDRFDPQLASQIRELD